MMKRRRPWRPCFELCDRCHWPLFLIFWLSLQCYCLLFISFAAEYSEACRGPVDYFALACAGRLSVCFSDRTSAAGSPDIS
mmetsp:Transcript_64877/g.171710  ORF Transcript_64877/g.171710 Transcript_64877/m.171710 type:complete len:81 (-) Transcript_64877:1214-1456(-)